VRYPKAVQRAGLGQGDKVHLIDDQQYVAGDLLLKTEQPFLVASLDQFAEQGLSGDEAHAMAKSQGDVGLAGAAVAQQQHVFAAGEDSQRASSSTRVCSLKARQRSRSCPAF
jgi:hypothetical protein